MVIHQTGQQITILLKNKEIRIKYFFMSLLNKQHQFESNYSLSLHTSVMNLKVYNVPLILGNLQN